jgi:hypothetical protein
MLLLTAMVAVVIVLGCESASAVSMTTGPTAAAKCQPQLAGSSNVLAAGGSGEVNITTQPECAWNAASQAGWITDLTPASGQGSGQLSFHAAANRSPSARTGEIVVNEGRIQVVQEAAPCVFEVRPGNLSIGPAGGTVAANVSALNGCAWSASVDVPWIRVTSGARGNGDGAAMFSVAANTGPLRSANISIAGQTFPITQDASGSVNSGPTPAPTPAPSPGGGDDDEGTGGGGKGKDKDKGKGKDLGV